MTKSFFAFLVLAIAAATGLAVYFLHVPYTVSRLEPEVINTATPVGPATTTELISSPKIKILLVPGHDLIDIGTSYKNLTEESLARKLAFYLNEDLVKDDRFETYQTRDFITGQYTSDFQTYFADQKTAIDTFERSLKLEMKSKLRSGEVVKDITVQHNNTSPRVGGILYGINKWANDNNIDLALHIHFNNYPHGSMTKAGAYSGYAIYVPEHQYANATSSLAIAQSINNQLSSYFSPSNLDAEKQTIIESQDLIAVGANNSRSSPSMLIEYGYIYEPQWMNDETAKKAADVTYQGLVNYYFPDTVKAMTKTVAKAKLVPQVASVVESIKNILPKKVSVDVSANAYLVANFDTGEVLLQDNKDAVLPIASVTKLVTALVTLKYLKKPVAPHLLYPLLMESSNEAAESLATMYGRDAFIALMNKEVSALGATKTHFVDPSGLSPADVSTPADLLKISRYINIAYPRIFTISDLRTYKVNGQLLKNPTRFLNMKTYIGGKNGFTNEAGNTSLSLFSIRGKEKTMKLAVIVLKSKDRDKDVVSLIQAIDVDRGVVQ